MDEPRREIAVETPRDPFAETKEWGQFEQLLGELAHAPAREPSLGAGSSIGRFSLTHVVGRGGCGVIYKARDTELGRDVAVKVMRTRGEANEEFSRALESLLKREAEAAAHLNHPNIITLYDYGTFDGSPYLILEFLDGETLENRIAKGPLTVEEAIPLMIQVAGGLAYAHRMGVIHRDLKPSNIFLTAEGQAKILDFGLARIQVAVAPSEPPSDDLVPEQTTRHVAGTPAYMAPEQWRGEAPDERTDVYAAGLMLYEMLVGQLPWPAADPRIAGLADQPAPPVRGVPAALAELIARALAKKRDERLPSSAQFLDGLVSVKRSLDSDRARRRTRLIRRLLIAAAPLLVGVGWAGVQITNRIDRTRTVDSYLHVADRTVAEARKREFLVDALRRRAFADFDALAMEIAESRWKSALAEGARLDRLWARAEQGLERALVLDGSRADVRHRLGEVLLARALLAERDRRVEPRDELAERLSIYGDAEAQARWRAPAFLSIDTVPRGASVIVQRFAAEGPDRLAPVATRSASPVVDLRLVPGSYLLLLSVPGRPQVRYPFVLGRGERYRIFVPIPRRIPDGFVYVPPGRFLYGCADEAVRQNFNAQPEHVVTTGPYFIARHEVTFADWIAYLDDLPAAERRQRTPRVDLEARATAAINSGANDLELRRLADGDWQLRLGGHRVRKGEPFVYLDRSRRSSQQWLRFPVVGISFADGQAFVAWLERTGRLPGARLCNEHEWERAARGADGRRFPHGDRFMPDDANIDETYGRRKRAFGPDEVGSHPASNSPFGLADLMGNVWEWTQSTGAPMEAWERGGSWYQDALTAASYNREFVEPTFHASLIGLRVCATVDTAD